MSSRQAGMAAKSSGLFGLFGVAYGSEKRRARHERSEKDKAEYKALFRKRAGLKEKLYKSQKTDKRIFDRRKNKLKHLIKK